MPETDLPIDDNNETTGCAKSDDSQSVSPLGAPPTEKDHSDPKHAASNPYGHDTNWYPHGPDK
jgi:hypothetical protein